MRAHHAVDRAAPIVERHNNQLRYTWTGQILHVTDTRFDEGWMTI